jgi:DNA-binding transcriptional LysR family regulator
VKFDLRIGEEFTDPVRTGVDIMIRLGRLPPSRMRSRKIASLRRVAIASPSYLAQRGRPETPTDLARHVCLIRSSAQDARAWTFHRRDGLPYRFPVESVFEADNAHVTMRAALAGMGIAIIPFYHVRDAVEVGLAEIVLDDFMLAPIPAYAVWPSGSRTPSRVQRFVDFLTQRLKKEQSVRARKRRGWATPRRGNSSSR